MSRTTAVRTNRYATMTIPRIHAISLPAALLALAVVNTLHAADTLVLDPSTVTKLTLERNPTLAQSGLAAEAEEYGRKSSLASLLPKLSASASYTHLDQPPTISGGLMGSGGGEETSSGPPQLPPGVDTATIVYMTGVLDSIFEAMFSPEPIEIAPQNSKSIAFTLSQPIFTGGARWNAYRAAEYNAKASGLSHQRTRDEMGLAALSVFYQYVRARQQYQAAVDEGAWLKELVRDQEVLLENGMITELDLLQTKLALSAQEMTKLRSTNAVTDAAEHLRLMLGLDSETVLVADTNNLWIAANRHVHPTRDTLDDRFLHREDFQAIQWQHKALQRAEWAQLAAYSPVLSAFLRQEYSNQYSLASDDLESQWSAGLSLNWLLLDWGENYNKVKRISRQKEALRIRYRDTRRHFVAAMRRLVRRIEESRKAVEIAREQVDVARRALDIAKARYEVNMVTNREVLNSRKELTAARMNLVGARIALSLALEEYRIGPSLQGSAPSDSPVSSPRRTPQPTGSGSQGPAASSGAMPTGGAGGARP